RYDTAAGLARDVERFLKDEPVEACPPSAAYRLRKVARKYRTALLTAAAFLALLVAGAAVSTWQAVRARAAERAAVEAATAAQEERDRAQAAEAQLRKDGASAQALLDFVMTDMLELVGTKIDDQFWQTLKRMLPTLERLADRFDRNPAVE